MVSQKPETKMIPSQDLITKYQYNVPRYTSYPPANFFTAQSAETYKHHIILSNNTNPQNISIYIHIPFCKKMCWYCGCNTSLCASNSELNNYVDVLVQEINMIIPHIDSTRAISQIHFGGGTPSILSLDEVSKILAPFTAHFTFTNQAEIAMECNPASLSNEYIQGLAQRGFTRISLGIQDFNHRVLQAVNREVPEREISEIRAFIQSCNMQVNFDFIYGLPFQTLESFTETIEKAIVCNPDRIVSFSYAHVPHIKPLQNKIEGLPMLEGIEKLSLLHTAYTLLTKAGYTPIGLDHFAKPTDELSLALSHKTLHRNFQGYCTRESTGQVYAFGASGISQFSHSFFQNYRDPELYSQAILAGKLATHAGYILHKQEQIISHTIETIMCNGYIDLAEIAQSYEISIEQIPYSKEYMHILIKDGLVENDGYTFKVTKLGTFFLRIIASCFDPKFQLSNSSFSSSI